MNSDEQKIILYSGKPTNNINYKEVIHIELTGSTFTSRKKMKEKLIEKAATYNCDAIMNVNFKDTFIWPQAFGVGIRFEK